jgi:hypothetical protein
LRAATLDVAIEGLGVTVDSESDDRGILAIDASVPAGPPWRFPSRRQVLTPRPSASSPIGLWPTAR